MERVYNKNRLEGRTEWKKKPLLSLPRHLNCVHGLSRIIRRLKSSGLGFTKPVRGNRALPGQNLWIKRFVLVGSMVCGKALTTSATAYGLHRASRIVSGVVSTSNV